jgi:NDP-sugar pyrophosphorylase family protein
VRPSELFASLGSLAALGEFFRGDVAPWQWVAALDDIFVRGGPLLGAGFSCIGDGIWVHESVSIAQTASIIGPAIIGENCHIRHGAYIRGHVVLGSGCVVGNSCEIKHSLLLDGAQVPHLNYVGDSVLGRGSHLGAGAVLSNLRLDGRPIKIHLPTETIQTGWRKLGAILGDGAQVGCNAVLQPGTIVERNAVVYPCVARGGYIAANGCLGKS